MPAVGGAGNSDRETCNASSTGRRGGERRANARSDANHRHGGVRNNIGNTIETSRADRRDESSLCVAIRPAAATRLRRNNSVTLDADLAKALRT